MLFRSSAAKGLERLEIARSVLQDLTSRSAVAGPAGADVAFLREAAADCRRHFKAGMDDDLNTALALAALYDLVREANRVTQGKEFRPMAGNQEILREVLLTLNELGGILGIWFAAEEAGDEAEIEALVQQRQEARAAKDWAAADRVRDELKARGVVLEDTPQGVRRRRG